MKKKDLRIAFFGTPEFATIILDQLHAAGFQMTLIVSAPDRPQGRGLAVSSPPVKHWADEQGIDCMQPEKLGDIEGDLQNSEWDLFIVAAYGKILPSWLLELPKKGVLNVHPSLLPNLRGSSPVQSAILQDMQDTGVTIMKLDEEMDHGPIIAQASVTPEVWPIPAPALEQLLAEIGGELLADSIIPWMQGEIQEEDQNHEEATYIQKISKEDGEINLDDDPYQNYLKICAHDPWPGSFFFMEKNGKKIRIKITDAGFKDGELIINTIIPEGKKEMRFEDFSRN